jgi:hypothetical protein
MNMHSNFSSPLMAAAIGTKAAIARNSRSGGAGRHVTGRMACGTRSRSTIRMAQGWSVLTTPMPSQRRDPGSRNDRRLSTTGTGQRTTPDGPTLSRTLVDDFFDEVERVLRERGIPFTLIRDEAKDGRN